MLGRVRFDLATQAPGMVLKLPHRGIEGIADGNIHVLMGVVLRTFLINMDVRAWHVVDSEDVPGVPLGGVARACQFDQSRQMNLAASNAYANLRGICNESFSRAILTASSIWMGASASGGSTVVPLTTSRLPGAHQARTPARRFEARFGTLPFRVTTPCSTSISPRSILRADVTNEQLAEQRKAKARERDRKRSKSEADAPEKPIWHSSGRSRNRGRLKA